MKVKHIVLAVLMFLGAGYVLAGPEGSVPKADTDQIAPASYYGVDYSTSVFSNTFTTVTSQGEAYSMGPIRFYGITFSTGLATDFVDVFDSTSVLNNGSAIMRMYNVTNTTAAVVGGMIASGFASPGPPGIPIRFKRGIIFRPSVATYNSITVYYWKETRQ